MSSNNMEASHPKAAHELTNHLANQPAARRILLLLLFCFVQFLDTFGSAALFSAVPVIATDIGLNNSQSVWLNSAYQLTFAAFLLISGRASDIYNPKFVFLLGIFPLGFLSIGIGFCRNKILLLILRAIAGIGASLTIPSALHLVVHMFPDPKPQAIAMSAFAGCGALGNVLGVIIGAIYISYASWPWIFWTSAIIALVVGTVCLILIPNPKSRPSSKEESLDRLRRLDIFGSSLLIIALVLFMFAVTSGSTDGWKTATVLVPLFLSVILFVAYFIWEAKAEEGYASLPPHLWFYPNFTAIVLLAPLPYAWWSTVFSLFSWDWQEVYGWSAISSAVYFLPIGLFSFPFMAFSPALQQKFAVKYIFLGGLSLVLGATIFFPFADSAGRYWPVVFPGFMLGTAGATLVFAAVNIAIFAATPPEVAGTVGAMLNCASQLGGSVFPSVATSIQTSIQPNTSSFKGRAAAFEFLIVVVALEIVSVLFFLKKSLRATMTAGAITTTTSTSTINVGGVGDKNADLGDEEQSRVFDFGVYHNGSSGTL